MRLSPAGRRLARLAATGAVLVLALPGATAEASHADFDWYGLGGCTIPVIGMPVDYDAVAGEVPPGHRDRLVGAGGGGDRQAVLLFLLSRCPTGSLSTREGRESTRDVTQVMVGALYDARRATDLGKAQFYLLASVVDWRPFAAAEARIGLPSQLVKGSRVAVRRDPLTGTGSFLAEVPAGPATFSATGRVFAPNPVREFPLDAAHFYEGPRALVRVHHDESWAVGNAADAVITAPAGSLVAKWMGATSRTASGIYYWDHDERHVHRYSTVIETIDGGPEEGGAPRARVECRRIAERRMRCAARLSEAGTLTLRLTRSASLYARARRSLPAGRSVLRVRARRALRPGAYRLELRVQGRHGSRSTAERIRLR